MRYKTLLVLGLTLGAVHGQPQRPRPTSAIKCTRDHLTSFQGRILDYKRGTQDISVRVRTDEDTTESFTFKWGLSEKVEAWFLIRGEAFKTEDWKRLESAQGKLQDGMRVVVWVCDDGSKPVFDWQPKEN